MRYTTIALCFTQALIAAPLTTQEIRDQSARLAKAAAEEPPLMALDTLLKLATVLKAAAPDESQKIYQQAMQHAASHPHLAVTGPVVRLWMDYDTVSAEPALSQLDDQRSASQALAFLYVSRKQNDQAATAAEAALRATGPARIDIPSLARIVAEHAPAHTPGLLRLPQIQSDSRYTATFSEALQGLLRAAPIKPEAVKEAADQLDALIQVTDFTPVDAKTALSELLDRVRKTTRADSQKPGDRPVTFRTPMPPRPPVDGNLALDDALAEIRKREPAYQQLGELWRYLQGKPRSAEEAKPILTTMIAWAERADDPRSDPAFFLQSLLNLDGRLGPPSRPWQLPREHRPMMMIAAAQAYQRLDTAPDRLAELALAMASEKVDIPSTLPSARNRIALDDFRRRLDSRYAFELRPHFPETELRAVRPPPME